jgi:hypothetical protein
MQLTRETIQVLNPLANKASRFYSYNLLSNWPHQLGVLAKRLADNGSEGTAASIKEILTPFNEVKKLLPIAFIFITQQYGQSYPQLDNKIQEDAKNLLSNYTKLIKISHIVIKILDNTFSEGEFKRLSKIVIKQLQELSSEDIIEFLEQYNIAVGATEVLGEETLDKISQLANGFEKVIRESEK